jgi:hypothetical protein
MTMCQPTDSQQRQPEPAQLPRMRNSIVIVMPVGCWLEGGWSAAFGICGGISNRLFEALAVAEKCGCASVAKIDLYRSILTNGAKTFSVEPGYPIVRFFVCHALILHSCGKSFNRRLINHLQHHNFLLDCIGNYW